MNKFILVGFFLIFTTALHAQSRPTIDSVKLNTIEQEAQTAAKSGDFVKASELAKQIIAMGVHDSGSYYLTAVVLSMAGKKDEARLYYDTAIAKGYDSTSETATLLGLNGPPPRTFNLDSAMAAIHSNAVEKSKHLPSGVKNAKLYQIYLEDQGERALLIQIGIPRAFRSGLAVRLTMNDAVRKKELYAMLPKLKKTGSAKDLQNAGLILQHGNDTTDYRTAHDLAMRAVTMGDTDARWLAAATLDRYLVNTGKPQRYGTQSFRNDSTGNYELYPVDPSITDAERAKWHVPPLRQSEKEMNTLFGNRSSDSTHSSKSTPQK